MLSYALIHYFVHYFLSCRERNRFIPGSSLSGSTSWYALMAKSERGKMVCSQRDVNVNSLLFDNLRGSLSFARIAG